MAVAERNFDFAVPAAVAVPRSLIVVAVPHACARITVTVDGRTVAVPIPTTYCHHQETQELVAAALAAALAPAGFTAALMRLPEKLLAVCAGVARYGRNNIAYVEGSGSFVELAVCVSDLATEADPWTGLARPRTLRDLRRLPARLSVGGHRRRSLSAARRALPDLAQRKRRALRVVDRPASGTSASGAACAVSASVPKTCRTATAVAETADFDERETALLLAGIDHDLLTGEPGLRGKLEELGLLGYDDAFLGVTLARNLKALLAAG